MNTENLLYKGSNRARSLTNEEPPLENTPRIKNFLYKTLCLHPGSDFPHPRGSYYARILSTFPEQCFDVGTTQSGDKVDQFFRLEGVTYFLFQRFCGFPSFSNLGQSLKNAVLIALEKLVCSCF